MPMQLILLGPNIVKHCKGKPNLKQYCTRLGGELPYDFNGFWP